MWNKEKPTEENLFVYVVEKELTTPTTKVVGFPAHDHKLTDKNIGENMQTIFPKEEIKTVGDLI